MADGGWRIAQFSIKKKDKTQQNSKPNKYRTTSVKPKSIYIIQFLTKSYKSFHSTPTQNTKNTFPTIFILSAFPPQQLQLLFCSIPLPKRKPKDTKSPEGLHGFGLFKEKSSLETLASFCSCRSTASILVEQAKIMPSRCVHSVQSYSFRQKASYDGRRPAAHLFQNCSLGDETRGMRWIDFQSKVVCF